jgi:hypothetical protein
MDSFLLILFATTAGFTTSGIIANLYRVCGLSADKSGAWPVRTVVMIFAGPTLFFEAAVRGLTKKEWSKSFFWMVAAGLAYWSLAIGLLVLDIALKLGA